MSKAISDIKKSVVTVTTAVKKKTKEIAEIAKLKIDIKMEESSLDHCFESLGRAVYAHSVTGKNEEKVQKLIAKAGTICKKIKEYISDFDYQIEYSQNSEFELDGIFKTNLGKILLEYFRLRRIKYGRTSN